ncbi:MAG: TetR/AcrR family transcriptional regulator [Streptomycetaceae bacterium]|nr:TetR/AcrR family transcriptional regulator [Streptomycetaceae bacterium]
MAATREPAEGRKTRARRGAKDSGEGGSSPRRAALVAIAAELFAERGYKATTVREIGDAAGVLSGSLYHHFGSKEEILDELLSSYMSSLDGTYREIIEAGAGPDETLCKLVAAAFESLAQHRAAITVLQNEREYLAQIPRFGYLDKIEDDVRRQWVGVIEHGVRDGVFRSATDPELTYRFLRDSVWVAVRWYRPDGPMTADQVAERYLGLVMDGLREPGSAGAAKAGKAAPKKTAAKRPAAKK